MMPHMFWTLPFGKKIVERVLPAKTKWKDIEDEEKLNEVIALLTLGTWGSSIVILK